MTSPVLSKARGTAAPTVGWSSISVAALLILFRPDAAALYLPLVLAALVASIVCLAARRLGHGFALLACVLLLPAVIVESVVLAQLAKPIDPPFSETRDDRSRSAAARAPNDESESIAEVSFLDGGRKSRDEASNSGCGVANERAQRASSHAPVNCRPDPD